MAWTVHAHCSNETADVNFINGINLGRNLDSHYVMLKLVMMNKLSETLYMYVFVGGHVIRWICLVPHFVVCLFIFA